MTSTQNSLKGKVESPFKADASESDMCGFTLMNNQVGEVMAEVMRRKEHVTVTTLPAMIRIDGKNRIDVDFAEIEETAGEEEGWFDQSEFENNISTHYGRLIFEDDRAIVFANPEDAAEELGFDLEPVQ